MKAMPTGLFEGAIQITVKLHYATDSRKNN